MTIVNRGLNNRKTRDTTQNDVSSRSIVIFAVFYSKVKASNHIHQKFSFIDLCGYERLAKTPIIVKRYVENLFINESLECLQ